MEQEIGYCTASDGVSIAYATIRNGPQPVIYANGWPSHLQLEWEYDHSRRLIEDLAAGCTLVRYDMRGTGLSDRDVDGFSLENLIKDLAAVVDHLELREFALISLGMLASPIAIRFAAENGGRVTRLVLSSAYYRGGDLASPERQATFIKFVQEFGFPHFGVVEQPNADVEQQRGVRAIARAAARREVEAALLSSLYEFDVSESVPALTMPTLIIHGRGDRNLPMTQAQEIAKKVPDSRFVTFDGSSSMPWAQREVITPEIHKFLGIETARQAEQAGDTYTILFADIADSTALTERLGDAAFREKARALDDALRGAIGANGGSAIDGKLLGDGVLATFDAAREAIACARACHAAAAGVELKLHVGVHAGDVIREDGNIFGGAVNIAARVASEAAPGETLVSGTVRDLARTSAGVTFDDRGERELKGIEEPQRLFAVEER